MVFTFKNSAFIVDVSLIFTAFAEFNNMFALVNVTNALISVILYIVSSVALIITSYYEAIPSAILLIVNIAFYNSNDSTPSTHTGATSGGGRLNTQARVGD